jgi:hypothetical protein
MRKSEWIAGLVYLLVLAVLALAGSWARRSTEHFCAQDGVRIEPAYRVRILTDQDRDLEFCCIHCAELWLRHEPAPRTLLVTDEISGAEIDAGAAYFVRSLVVTNPTTGNRIHAFRWLADAEEHARTSQGKVLEASERPFHNYQPSCPCTESPR